MHCHPPAHPIPGACPSCAADHVGALFSQIHHLNHQLMDEALTRYDLAPMQARTLGFIICESARREVSQRDIAQAMRIRPSTVNGIVERLEEKALITRTAGKTDARCRILRPTEKSEGLDRCVHAAMRRSEERMLTGFSAQEQEALRGYLQRIAANLQNSEDISL